MLHIDMNSYFASVEQQANPFLRNKPLGVCAYLSKNGCIIGSSIEAKDVGIKTGCRVADAVKLYPAVNLIENEPSKYRSTTTLIFSILGQYTDQVEPYSIDEAFLDMTGWANNFNQLEKQAAEIQNHIKDMAGEWMRSSIGIASTRWLAKFASDIAEPDSVLTINEDNLESILKARSLTDAWGINYRMERRYKALGIHDLLDLKQADPGKLLRALGKPGYFMWANLNGRTIDKVSKPKDPKTIGHSYCLPKKTTDLGYLKGVMYKLCERAGRRLRDKNLESAGVAGIVGFVDGGGYRKHVRLGEPIFDTLSIFEEVDKLLFSTQPNRKIRFLAMNLFSLRPVSGQMSWLDNCLQKRQLAKALDVINNKYGDHTIYPGQMFGMQGYARDRVGYRKTVDLPDQEEITTLVNEYLN